MKDHYSMFAAYNGWANKLLYHAAAQLTDQQYYEDRAAFFGSVHGTLHHLLVADLLWMNRFDGKGEVPDIQDLILHKKFLHDRLDTLLEARRTLDERIIDYTDNVSEDKLAADFSYRTIVEPEDITQPLAPALAHFFNHQTHHRGQVHTLLTQLAGKAPSLDLLYYLREQKSAA